MMIDMLLVRFPNIHTTTSYFISSS